ncbi:MAG TPA: adenine phosphoribosyltransferase [Ktedonobacteraceae bacterium]|nr:adenine phosphoribosyltransferase [Ktedonobacteraceae bacterium]
MSFHAEVLTLKEWIREVPDFPQPGILFKDITPLLKNYYAFNSVLKHFASYYASANIQTIVGIESRGFIFGAPLAQLLQCSFVPIRKAGKLPAQKVGVAYSLHYGTDVIEIHTDAIDHGQRLLIVDDVLATGGTAKAAIELVEGLGGTVVSLAFLIELLFKSGRENIGNYDICTLLTY